MAVKALLAQVARSITPSEYEDKKRAEHTKSLIKTLGPDLKKHSAKLLVGGSVAKGTHLGHTNEVDIFVQFPPSYARKPISDILHNVLKKHFKPQRLHGSRDYFMVSHNLYDFELIPIIKITESHRAHNITDISPLHATWVKRHGASLRSDIRLTKAFMQSAHIYGAESHIRGFSGYACEVLTIHYGGFTSLLRAASKWEGKVVVDPLKYHKRKNVLLELNKSKTTGPLILIDPVQYDRNVTAAVSEKSFAVFVSRAGQFIKEPDASFFEVRVPTTERIKKGAPRGCRPLLVHLTPKKNKRDVMGAVALKKYFLMSVFLSESRFVIHSSDWYFDGASALVWFYISTKPRKPYLHQGPEITQKEHAAKFKKKYPSAKKRGSRLVVTLRPPFSSPKAALAHLMKSATFKYKLSSASAEW